METCASLSFADTVLVALMLFTWGSLIFAGVVKLFRIC